MFVNRQGKKKKGNRGGAKRGALNPPMFTPTLRLPKKCIRFTNSAAISSAVTITAGDLATLIGFGTSTTSITSIVDAIRIKKFEVWGAAAPGNTVAFEFESGTSTSNWTPAAPSRLFSDTSLGMTYAPHVVGKPPTNSAAGMWSSGLVIPATAASIAVLIVLSAPANSIFDLWVEFSLIDEGLGQVIAVTTAVANALHVRAISSGVFTPVSFRAYIP